MRAALILLSLLSLNAHADNVKTLKCHTRFMYAVSGATKSIVPIADFEQKLSVSSDMWDSGALKTEITKTSEDGLYELKVTAYQGTQVEGDFYQFDEMFIRIDNKVTEAGVIATDDLKIENNSHEYALLAEKEDVQKRGEWPRFTASCQLVP